MGPGEEEVEGVERQTSAEEMRLSRKEVSVASSLYKSLAGMITIVKMDGKG